VNITSPADGSSVLADKQRTDGTWYKAFSLTWTAIDPEEGVLPFSGLKWYDSIDNGATFTPLEVTATTFTLPGPGSIPITTTSYSVELGVTSGSSAATTHILKLVAQDNGIPPSIASDISTVTVNVLN
jgi:hypothetical protein